MSYECAGRPTHCRAELGFDHKPHVGSRQRAAQVGKPWPSHHTRHEHELDGPTTEIRDGSNGASWGIAASLISHQWLR